MRFIGGKSLMTEHILDVIQRLTLNVRSAVDIFSGSGVVAQAFKAQGYEVTANDILYFSFVLNQGILCNNTTTPRLMELLAYLNGLATNQCSPNDPHNFIAHNYTPNDTCSRMYFQRNNALKIDIIRQEIDRLRPELTNNEYFYLLASLISAVPFIANITGTYAAYLKYWDVRTNKPLTLEPLPVVDSIQSAHVFNMNAIDLASHIQSDIAYLDPPYNEREYLPNYHILETIARYDYPKIHGITGIRTDNDAKSDFCRKSRVHQAFSDLLKTLNCRYILISYNTEGLLNQEELIEILHQIGIHDTFHLYEYPYRRYKNKIPNNTDGLKEQLYFIEKQ